MSKLLNFVSGEDKAAHYFSPDEIVRAAECLGRLEIDHDFGSKAYRAKIRFDNRNGSTIWATGTDTDFFTAIAKAIQEAERLA